MATVRARVDASTEDELEKPRRRTRSAWQRYGFALLLVAISLVYSVTITLRHTQEFSPVDEYMYYDALFKFEEHGMVRQGDDTGSEARKHVSCVGVFYQGKFGTWCPALDNEPEPYPFDGKSTADAYTPAYITTAYYGAHVFQALGVEDLLTAARLTSALWLAAGMAVLFALLRSFRLRPLLAFALGLCYLGSPIAWWSGTFLTTDAPSLFFGALLMLLARLLVTKRASGWWLVLAAVVAVIFKVTHVLAIGAAILYVLATFYFRVSAKQPALLRSPRRWRELPNLSWIGYCVAGGVLAVTAQVIWLMIRAANAVGPVPPVIPAKFGVGELINQFTNFVTSTFDWNVSPGPIYPMPPYLSMPLMWTVLLSVVGSLLILPPRRNETGRALQVTAVWAGLLAAPMLAAALYFTQGYYFSIPGRYALSLLPVFLLFIGTVFPKRYLTSALLGYGIITIGWAIGYAFTAGHY